MTAAMSEALLPCALCGVPSRPEDLAEAGWLAPELEPSVAEEHPGWRRQDGACPACVQQILLEALLSKGENAFQEGIQRTWLLVFIASSGVVPDGFKTPGA